MTLSTAVIQDAFRIRVVISVIDQDLGDEDSVDMDEELEVAKLMGKKKKSKKNKKKKKDDDDILVEASTVDGLYFYVYSA